MPKKDKQKIKEVIDALDGTKNTAGPGEQRKWVQSRGDRVRSEWRAPSSHD